MVIKIAILVLLGGIAELDRTAVYQGMLSEPVILCPLIGLLLGAPVLGIKAGILMQLFFLGAVSIGGATPRDSAMASMVVTGAAGLSGIAPDDALFSLAILMLMIPASRYGRGIEEWLKESNVRLAHKADEQVAAGNSVEMERMARGRLIALFALWATAVSFGIMAGGMALLAVYNNLPYYMINAFADAGRLLPAVAAGIALNALRLKRANAWYAAGCAVLLFISAVVE